MKLKIKRKALRMAIAGGVLTAGVAVPTLAVVACGTSSSSAPVVSYAAVPAYEYKGPDVSTKSFFAVMSDPENPRWQKALSDIKAAGAEAKFAEVIGQIQKGQVDQNNALSAALDKDVYLLGATTDAGFASQINSLTKSTAQVIAYDRLLKVNNPKYNWYVTFDSNQVGRLQGLSIINALYGTNFTAVTTSDQQVIDAVKAKPRAANTRVLAVAGDPSDNNSRLFFGGAKAVLDLAVANDTKLLLTGSWEFTEVAQAGWDYSKGQTFLQTALTKLSNSERQEVAAILSPNDGMAVAATNAARYAGVDPNKVWITGLDSNDSAIIAITNNTGQDMTVFKPDFALARVAVALAAELLTAPTTATPQEILASITKTYPLLSQFGPKLDTTSYEAPGATANDPPKKINTILLDPVMVTSANVKQYFTVS